MAKKQNLIESALDKHNDQLLFELSGRLTAVPSTACKCGKPVVFIFPETEFTCSRCGLVWKLTVEVKEVARKQ